MMFLRSSDGVHVVIFSQFTKVVGALTTVTVATDVFLTVPVIARLTPLCVKLPFHVESSVTNYVPGCEYV